MITAEQMKSKLSTVAELRERLGMTEPLTSTSFQTEPDAPPVFKLPSGFNSGLKEAPGESLTMAHVQVGGMDKQLTKDALLQATSLIGLTKDYICRTPAEFLEPQTNYWFSHRGEEMKLFFIGDTGLAFSKGSINPFSNLELLDVVTDKITAEYKIGADELLVDFKVTHDLRYTAFRLIVPESIRTIHSQRSGGVEDDWSLGIDVSNSLTGEKPLELAGYLFCWTCANGATSTHATSGHYNRRRQGGDQESALAFAANNVEEIIGSLDHELESVAELATKPLNVAGELSDTVQSLFTHYRVPLGPRESILAALIESDDITSYGLMQAITQAANEPGLSATVVASLLRVGGDLSFSMSSRCDTCHRFQDF